MSVNRFFVDDIVRVKTRGELGLIVGTVGTGIITRYYVATSNGVHNIHQDNIELKSNYGRGHHG